MEVPKGRLVVITGPSGSGKSSLAFHTLFAEGQRRYVESLSVYARQFLDQLEKPEVDAIEGLSPAIAIEQRTGGLNPRSTVATATELYDYLRVLWAAAGVPHDPATGERLSRMGAAEIVGCLADLGEGAKVVLLAPIAQDELAQPQRLAQDLQRQGFLRLRIDGTIRELEEALHAWPESPQRVEVVVDRFTVRSGMDSRIADSVETALRICGTEALAAVCRPGAEEWSDLSFQTSWRNPRTGFMIGALSPKHFSFNSHLGACTGCGGLGSEEFSDPDLWIRDPSLPLLKGGLRGWWPEKSSRQSKFRSDTAAQLRMRGLGEDATAADLDEEAMRLLFEGGEVPTGWTAGVERTPQTRHFEGLASEALRLLRETKNGPLRARLSRLMAHRPCRTCSGGRLKAESLAVRVPGADGFWLGIREFCAMGVGEASEWINTLAPQSRFGDSEVLQRLVNDIGTRLSFLREVGLDYLALDRPSGTLSGGEAQRIRLASQLGAGLSGVIYVLDEPSIGLHPADTGRLIGALQRLRDLGNTVVVVEHDEMVIRAADHVIDMGPGAGSEGGSIVGEGPPASLDSPTGAWLRTARHAKAPSRPAAIDTGEHLVIRGARAHNLRNIDVTIPLGRIVCIAGPSGSGKSTLADDILRRALARHFHGTGETPGTHDRIEGLAHIGKLVVADQSPIGRSPRSNPATFTGLFDEIRSLYARLPLSRQRGYAPGRFSFNAGGGRCDRCEGNGRLRIEMHFLPDAWIPCPSCGGARFNRETLEVSFKGRSIAEALDLQVAEAIGIFGAVPKIRRMLSTLDELGLGYLKLGQAANTLSGGEAQRLKLAVELARPSAPHTLYLFDEPTTGLHFGDVERLLAALARLRDAGHSVLVVEHHPDVIEAADWVIELGPGGGTRGGSLVAQGPPPSLAANPQSPTGRALGERWRTPAPR